MLCKFIRYPLLNFVKAFFWNFKKNIKKTLRFYVEKKQMQPQKKYQGDFDQNSILFFL